MPNRAVGFEMHAIALLVISLLLAGCVDPAQTNGSPRDEEGELPEGRRAPDGPDGSNGTGNASPAGGPPRITTIQLDCSEMHSGFVPLTEEEFAALAPSGFAPGRYGGGAGLVASAPLAGLIVHSHQCTFNGDASRHLVIYVPVEPPAEYERGEWNAILVGGFFQNADVQVALAAWGLGDVAIPGDVQLTQPAPGTGESQGTGNYSLTLRAAQAAPMGFFPEKWRVFGVKERVVVAAFDMERSGEPLGVGAATVDIAGEDAPIVLQARAGEGHLFGTVEYTFTHVRLETGG